VKESEKFAVPSQVSIDQNDASLSIVKLYFDGQVSSVSLSATGVYSSEQIQMMSGRLSEVAAWADIHTVLGRRNVNHPFRSGLVPVYLGPSPVGVAGGSAADAAGAYRYGSDAAGFYEALAVDESVLAEGYGWFAEGSDPNAFGTFYLTAVGSLDTDNVRLKVSASGGTDEVEDVEADEDEDGFNVTDHQYGPIGFLIGQVGVQNPGMGFATWDDCEGVAKLVATVLEGDIETSLTMRALMNAEEMREASEGHAYRQALYAARELFADVTLRPRMIPDLADAVAKQQNVELNSQWYSRDSRNVASRLFTLDDYQIFGWRNPAKPVAAVHRVAFKKSLSKGKFNDYVAALKQGLIAKKQFDTVIVTVDGDYDVLYLTRSVEAFQQCRAAFHVREGSQFVVTRIDASDLPARRRANAQAA
jgi:hypothetical protein